MKKLITTYKLIKISQNIEEDNSSDERFPIQLFSRSENNYGYIYSCIDEFQTHEEAIQHALNSKHWLNTDFIILPVYRVSTNIADYNE